jgi:hypothetical protein
MATVDQDQTDIITNSSLAIVDKEPIYPLLYHILCSKPMESILFTILPVVNTRAQG